VEVFDTAHHSNFERTLKQLTLLPKTLWTNLNVY
jgi:hypothetical protein